MSLQGILYTLKPMVGPDLEELRAFHFSATNPVFWMAGILLFLVMGRFWHTKKAFSFSLIVCVLLLLTTMLEGFTETWLTSAGETFDPLPIRVIAFFIILMIFFYYSLIRD